MRRAFSAALLVLLGCGDPGAIRQPTDAGCDVLVPTSWRDDAGNVITRDLCEVDHD